MVAQNLRPAAAEEVAVEEAHRTHPEVAVVAENLRPAAAVGAAAEVAG